MATKKINVRIFHYSNNGYNFMELQILEVTSNGKLLGYASPVGSVTFQQNKGETDWYGKTFKVDSGRVSDLEVMTKVAKKIHRTSNFRSQPDEVIKGIKADVMFYQEYLFLNEKDKGKYCFKVYANEDYYWNVVAKDETEAQSKLDHYIENDYYGNPRGLVFTLRDKFLIE